MELTLWQTSRTLLARVIHLTLLTGLVAGCSGSGPKKEAAAPPPPPPAESTAADTMPAPQPATSNPMPAAETAPMPSAQSSGPMLADNAPKTYTVKKDDTL